MCPDDESPLLGLPAKLPRLLVGASGLAALGAGLSLALWYRPEPAYVVQDSFALHGQHPARLWSHVLLGDAFLLGVAVLALARRRVVLALIAALVGVALAWTGAVLGPKVGDAPPTRAALLTAYAAHGLLLPLGAASLWLALGRSPRPVTRRPRPSPSDENWSG